ncbi:MAG: hydrogenase small subunit [Euryarchaeota archaeon]|nr:hydrogenase small subunit [Euryarchaeota archaeon]MCG2728663.1 hydrogenase small subunit [Candidatus Methanoperedenaceae archaeon]
MLTNRRNFLKLAGAVGAGMFLDLYSSDIVRAMEQAGEKGVKLVWIQGQSDTGCTVSLVQGKHPDIYDAIMKLNVDIRFHPTIMAAYGDEAMDALKIEPDVLVVEGAIPDAKFAKVGERPFIDLVRELAGRTKVGVVAVGACATHGGIPAAKGNLTNARGVRRALEEGGVQKPVINLPGCPPHPDLMLITLASVIITGKIPELDSFGRPAAFYRKMIHDECARRGFYDKGEFAESFAESDLAYAKCLWKLGCKGPVTLSDCAFRKWNNGVNVCMNAGAPCIGCYHEAFPDAVSPLFVEIEKIPTLLGINAVTAGKVALGVTAAGIAYHAVRRQHKPPFKEETKEEKAKEEVK